MTSGAGPSEAMRHGGGRRTKNLQGEIKKKKKRREERKRKEEKEKRNEKKERKGEESKREKCIRPMGVKHPLRTVKRYKTHETRGAEKVLKKQEERKRRQKWPEKTW